MRKKRIEGDLKKLKDCMEKIGDLSHPDDNVIAKRLLDLAIKKVQDGQPLEDVEVQTNFDPPPQPAQHQFVGSSSDSRLKLYDVKDLNHVFKEGGATAFSFTSFVREDKVVVRLVGK